MLWITATVYPHRIFFCVNAAVPHHDVFHNWGVEVLADFSYIFYYYYLCQVKTQWFKKLPALNCWVRCVCRTSTILSHSGPALYWTLMVKWKEPDKWLLCLDHYNSPRWWIPSTAIYFLLQTQALLTADLMQFCCPSVSPHCQCEHHRCTGESKPMRLCGGIRGSYSNIMSVCVGKVVTFEWHAGCDSQPGYFKAKLAANWRRKATQNV